MTKLNKLIEMSKLEKLNRKNRFEGKIKQQKYYGELEELFDPLTKTLNANNEQNLEQNLALGEQRLRAIDWPNLELDKQTKMIENIRLTRNKALMTPDLSNGAVEEARDKPGIIVDKDTAHIIHLMTNQSNPQLKLMLGDLDIGEYKTNGVEVTYQKNAFMVRDNIYEFSDGLINFLTNPDVTNSDIREDENKIKKFLLGIGYDMGTGDKKISRYRTMIRKLGIKD